MPLSPNTRIGPYEVLALLGAGGMGEVYRARDTRLGRDVALKVLPEVFAKDTERMARFEREAQLLASLNHPNIATLHGLEESEGVRALVMELVEGPTLAERIAAGPLPAEEAIPVARQIAEALEAAHDKGIIHRDLKPGNVKLTRDGAVKVLDFGLAKALDDDPGATGRHNSPTLSLAATRAGVILGTAGYMSPEQAKGKIADRRADIRAFGVVLYEMLAGRPLLRRCLEKDPRRRLQAMGEARLVLEEDRSLKVAAQNSVAAPKPAWVAWGMVAIATLAAVILAFVHFRETPPAERTLRYTLAPPEKTSIQNFAVSPDGRQLAFVAADEGKRQLWVRALDALQPQVLPGTDDAGFPFWSPDSRYIAFFAGGKLKKIAANGGPTQTLCDAPQGRGGTWNGDGGIHVAFLDGKLNRRLLPDNSSAAYVPPAPGSRLAHLLFLRENTLMAQPFDTKTFQVTGELFPVAEQVSYAPVSVWGDGLLVYLTGRSAVGFQLGWRDRSGKGLGRVPTAVLPAGFALSLDEKTLAIPRPERPQAPGDLWLHELARGVDSRFTFHASRNRYPVWSPDGRRVAFASDRKGRLDLYLKDASGAGQDQLLLQNENPKSPLHWSRDGKLLLYNEFHPKTRGNLWVLPIDGDRKPAAFLQTEFHETRAQFSPDGKWVAYDSDESGRFEVYVRPFPSGASKWKISPAGGVQPRWRSDGKELYYLSPQRELLAVPVKGAFEAGAPQLLFNANTPGVNPNLPYWHYEVSADGKRFLTITSGEESGSETPVTVVVNWLAGLKK